MEDSSEGESNSMSDLNLSAGSSYYYYSDAGDTHGYDENSQIEKEIIQGQKTTSGQKIDKEFESTLNTLDTKEADISSAKQLRTHMRRKIQEKKTEPKNKYICRKCGRSYRHKRSLYNHQKFECDVTPQFICQFCDKRFKQKTNMNTHNTIHHLRNSRTPKARHKCDQCSRSYVWLRGLDYHRYLEHAEVKPKFICDVCSYKTNDKFSLIRHISFRHSKNSKESQARHNCDKCSRSYVWLACLYRHKRLKHAAINPI